MMRLYLNENRGKYIFDMIEENFPNFKEFNSTNTNRYTSIIISKEELEQYQTLEEMINLLILKLEQVREGL